MKENVHKTLRLLLAYGTLAYGVLSLARFQRFAELTNMAEDEVQKMAMRDIGAGIALLTVPNPVPSLIGIAVSDFRDGARLLRSQPRLAPVAFLWGIMAIVTIVTRPSRRAEAPAAKAEPEPATAR